MSASVTCAPQSQTVEIVLFQPELKAYFKALNIAWIEQFFKVEAEDLRVLDNPQETIIAIGGQIFFARYNDEIVGTCALIPHGDTFELAKMGVDESYRGLKIGRKLLESAIAYAKEQGVAAVTLETNSSLKPAVTMYESVGFKHIPVPSDSPYVRADVAMRLDF